MLDHLYLDKSTILLCKKEIKSSIGYRMNNADCMRIENFILKRAQFLNLDFITLWKKLATKL